MRFSVLALVALAATVSAQRGIPNINCLPDAVKISFIQRILCNAPVALSRLCRLQTPGEPQPVTCNCGSQSSLVRSVLVDDIKRQDLTQFSNAWNLWSCRPTECTCANGETVKIPVAFIPDRDLPPLNEQQHLLCDALKKLPDRCETRSGGVQRENTCQTLPPLGPKQPNPACQGK